jgi:ectoine hydroxylase-related dioxygenase (phytanoyl-CoA dioxygenase family)
MTANPHANTHTNAHAQPSQAPVQSPNPLQFTVEQRLHLDIQGYVVIERFVPPAQVAELRETLAEIEARFRTDGTRPRAPSFLSTTTVDSFRVDNLPHLAPCFHRYPSDPRVLGRAEEMMGHEVRLEQSDAHIRRPLPSRPDAYGFHRHNRLGLGSVERNGLYHFPFVKALTNLSDLGPDDGGTAVIAGTHKLPGHLDPVLVAAAARDPALVHHVVAPAGSTLFFYESLLHSSGINRSGKDRPLVLGGYTPTLFQPQHGENPDPAFLATLPQHERDLYSGAKAWEGSERHRELTY